jgi:hypothetical protein
MKLFNYNTFIYVCTIMLVFNNHIFLVKTNLSNSKFSNYNRINNRKMAIAPNPEDPDAEEQTPANADGDKKAASSAENGQFNPDNKVVPLDGSDAEVKKIRDEIYKQAKAKMKSSNLGKKGRQYGKFTNNYNEYIKARGNDSRKNKNLWPFMNDVAKTYEYCINPIYNVNYSKWCDNSYTGNKTKLDGKNFV